MNEEFFHLRMHDVKHTLGRRLRAAGVSNETRKVLLGHTNGDITTDYSVGEISELICAAEKSVLFGCELANIDAIKVGENAGSRKSHAQKKNGFGY